MNWIERLKELVRRARNRTYGWSGNYGSWSEALGHAGTYDDENILQKVKTATLSVKNAEAPYERDGVVFEQVQYSWPLLAALMWIAAQKKGRLTIADFGGSLGSSYFQNKQFLQSISEVHWGVVEQPSFVRAGKEFIQDEKLQFYYSLEEFIEEKGIPDLLLLSCVLPYLENPYESLAKFVQYGIPYLMIDNTYFNYEARDRITVQKVPPSIYTASYPCWFLDYDKVKALLLRNYTLVSEHMNDSVILLDGKKIQYRGLLLKKRDESD